MVPVGAMDEGQLPIGDAGSSSAAREPCPSTIGSTDDPVTTARRGQAVRAAVSVSFAVGLLLLAPSRPEAHEIPADVTVQAFMHATGQRMRVIVRVPLEAMRDFDWPVTGPGYLDLDRVAPMLRDAARLWIADYVQLYEEARALSDEEIVAARVSLPSDPSFSTFETALANVMGSPLPSSTLLPWEQAVLDVLLEVPVASATSRFSIDPEWAHLGLRTLTVLRFVTPSGAERAFQYTGNPGLVRLDPRWHQAALRFTRLGFHHILEGIDHLLFVLCLVIPFRRVGPLIPIVTSFTVAHSITLIASALGLTPSALWFPPLIETLIALSIVYMAVENIFGANAQRRWLLAFAFGLVHGFGFSFLLRESLQFAGGHLLSSLLFFNIGVELGQLFVLLLMVPLLNWLFRRVSERMGVIVLSAVVAHEAWHWMTNRGGRLLQYDFRLPILDASLLATFMRWLMLGLIVAGTVWGLSGLYRWLGRKLGQDDAMATAGG